MQLSENDKIKLSLQLLLFTD